MKIRMKAKHYHGKYGKVLSSNPKMVPGCLNYQDRLRLHQQRAAGLITPEQFKERAFEVEKSTIAEGRRQRKTAPDVINMFLRHGDIVIMDGRRIQEFYEASRICVVEAHGLTPQIHSMQSSQGEPSDLLSPVDISIQAPPI
jgi:hypothetical protein